MKKEKRIPTIVAFLILILGIVGGVFLIRNASSWFIGANPEITPKEVKITNITENSFTVSWVTDSQTLGFVKYGTDKEIPFTAQDDRDQLSGNQGNFFTHHVTLKGLTPSTNYFFKINSGGKLFDNNGQLYEVKTAPSLQGSVRESDVAYGTILKQDGSPAEGVIVYLTLANASPLSTLTRSSGNWMIPLNLARSIDLSSWAAYDKEASVEEIFVQGGPAGTATAISVTKNDNPLPPITLGGNFDFRQAPPSPEPTSSFSSSTSTSGFSLGNFPTPTPVLKIINPSQGEEVSTPKPEIFGTGPGGETLTIIVESPETIQGKVVISQDGSWRWTPQTNLSPGPHTVTVRLPNGQQVSHSFVVLAAGDENTPSFTASPSATLAPTPTLTPTPVPTRTPTPTPTLTPTPVIRSSLPSTEGGIPQSGELTPTFLFFTMGLSLIFLGILGRFLWKKI
jgi:uncharacterized protein YxeA